MTYDVAIVGAGIVGSMMAYRLSKKGLKVVLIEAGNRGETLPDMVNRFAASTIKIPSSPYNDGISYTNAPAPKVYQDVYYDQKGPDKFKSTYLRRVGGTTWHWLGNVPRFLPKDFKLNSTYGVACDWPIGYDDLEPWYCEAEDEIGVSGNHAEWDGFYGAGRSKSFPMPAIELSYSDRILHGKLNGQNINGFSITLNSTPQARNSEAYDGRPPCLGSSSCVPICPVNAKYNGSVHTKKAIDAGTVLLDRHIVTQLCSNSSNDQVTSLKYRTWDGIEDSVNAKRYVLAAHAVESAKLLLMSEISNSSDQVGRNLMDHLNGAAGAILPQPVYPFRGPPTTSGIDNFRDGNFRSTEAAFRMSLGNNGWGRMEAPDKTLNELIHGEGLFGSELKNRLRERITRMFRISYSTEMLPNPSNRIVLSAEPDSIGLPKPQIQMEVDEYNYQAFKTARKVISEIFQKLSAVETKFEEDERKYKGAGHIMGTCKMGESRKSSVVDSDCRSHDVKNLFIVGSSVFPTGATANPTLTVAALALRAADTIATEFAS